jgi:phosphatidylserine/phosphatidylglycerophosphate/cardiolipin synthase-like enzyme
MEKFGTTISILILVVSISSCTVLNQPPPTLSTPEVTPTVDTTPADGWYEVYFSDPASPTAGTYRGGPDEALANAIRESRLSVDAAIYHLNLWSIRDALIAAHNAGVAVRVVLESDNMDEVEVQELRDAGIEVLGDRRRDHRQIGGLDWLDELYH